MELTEECVMCTERNILGQTMCTNGLNMGLLLRFRREKTQWLSSKEKVPGAAVSKEGYVDNHLRLIMTHHNCFPLKKVYKK